MKDSLDTMSNIFGLMFAGAMFKSMADMFKIKK